MNTLSTINVREHSLCHTQEISYGSVKGNDLKKLSSNSALSLMKNHSLLRWHPLEIALWFEKCSFILKKKLLDPAESWKIQMDLNTLFSKRLQYRRFEKLRGEWICTAIGNHKKLPLLNWENETENYPIYESIKFVSEDLIHTLKKQSYLLTPLIIKKFFNLLKSIELIDWTITRDGCSGRADLVYQYLVSAGVPANALEKQYCIGCNMGANLGCRWKFHVTISIQDHLGMKWMIDPSVLEEPTTYEYWIKKFVSPRTIIRKIFSDCPFDRIRNPKVVYALSHSINPYFPRVLDDKVLNGQYDFILNSFTLSVQKIYNFVAAEPLFRLIVWDKLEFEDPPSNAKYKLAKARITHFSEDRTLLPILPKHINAIEIKHFKCYKQLLDDRKLDPKQRQQLIEKCYKKKDILLERIKRCITKFKFSGFSQDKITQLQDLLNLKKNSLDNHKIFR
jgi:hypothetical protein